MTTQDDKLLGEKLHYYCSSSEDEVDPEEKHRKGEPSERPVPVNAANTGPKGVIADWRRFKQLEKENREEQDAEKARLAHKLTITCRTDREDAQAKEEEQKKQEEYEVFSITYIKGLHFCTIVAFVFRSCLKTTSFYGATCSSEC